jgi:hypothetical protein
MRSVQSQADFGLLPWRMRDNCLQKTRFAFSYQWRFRSIPETLKFRSICSFVRRRLGPILIHLLPDFRLKSDSE